MNTFNCLVSKKIYIVSISVQLAMIGVFGSSYWGYDLPILRQIIGIIFLSFIPGYLILSILKINNLNATKLVLYSLGISLFFTMFLGFGINQLMLYIGISTPLSMNIIMPTYLINTIVMSIYVFHKAEFKSYEKEMASVLHENKNTPAFTLLFICLPLLSIVGATIVTYYHNNFILILLLVLISLIFFILVYSELIPKQLYSLAILSISLSLLFHYTFTSPHIVGWDIHITYYIQNLIITNQYWEYIPFSNVNSVLSSAIIGPIYSIVLNLDTVWILKFIYPFIFAFVPLGLFEIYRDQLGYRKAIIPVFFFMSIFTFFTEMTALPRQQIAELFYVLLLLTILDNSKSTKKAILGIIFVMGISVSHYGLTYILIFMFTLSWFIYTIMNRDIVAKIIITVNKMSGLKLANPKTLFFSDKTENKSSLSGSLLTIFIIFSISWYIYITPGLFNTIIHIGQSFSTNITEFFEPTATQTITISSLGGDMHSISNLGKTYRFVHIITEILIIIGFFKFITTPNKYIEKPDHFALILANYALLSMCVILPYFSNYLNVTRLYHIVLFLISPFIYIGYEALFSNIKKISSYIMKTTKRKYSLFHNKKANLKCFPLLILIIMYFLFNTGLILEFSQNSYKSGDTPGSIPLNYGEIDAEYYNSHEVNSLYWLSNFADENNHSILADRIGRRLLTEKFAISTSQIPPSIENVPSKSYIFLRTWNIQSNQLSLIIHKSGVQSEIQYIETERYMANNINKIFTNNKSYIYKIK